MKTRQKIIKESLFLFNQTTFESSTTNLIAEKSEVLEGSLWYHFNTKKDILAEHIRLLRQVFLSKNVDTNSSDPKTIIQGIFRSYDFIWDFRYILRDDFQKSLKEDEPVLETVRRVNHSLDQWAVGRIQHSYAKGVIQINPQNIENLSEITLVIGRYWLDFSSKKNLHASDGSLRKKGLDHIFTVLMPYLSSKAKLIIRHMMDKRVY